MPFGLKNAGATYQRAMTALFHDMIHKEMEVHVDDMIAKSWAEEDREFEESVWQIAEIQSSSSSAKAYKAGRRFGASSGKLLGFIVSRREIEVDLQKPKQLSTCRYQRQRKKSGLFWAGYNTSAGSLPSSHPSVSRSLNCSERRPRLFFRKDRQKERGLPKGVWPSEEISTQSSHPGTANAWSTSPDVSVSNGSIHELCPWSARWNG